MNTWLHQEDQQNVSIKHRHSNHLSFRHRHSNNSTLPIVFLSLKLPPPPCAVIYWYINWQNMQVSCTNEHMHIGGAFCNFVAYTVFMNSFPQFSTDVVHDNWGKMNIPEQKAHPGFEPQIVLLFTNPNAKSSICKDSRFVVGTPYRLDHNGTRSKLSISVPAASWMTVSPTMCSHARTGRGPPQCMWLTKVAGIAT